MVTKDTADYWAIMRHFDARRIPFYTSHSNSLKLARTIIQQLPGDTPVKDSANESVALGYSVISVWQMTASRTQPQGEGGGLHTINIPLFSFKLPRNEKVTETFKLKDLGHLSGL